MKTVLLTVGRVQDPFREADRHYRGLLDRYQPITVVEARDDRDLVSRLPAGGRLAALDREGKALDSIGWSRWLDERRLEARDVCIVIGGPEGLPAEVFEAADDRISLGPATLAHQVARVVVLEQLFRAAKILAGEAYHR